MSSSQILTSLIQDIRKLPISSRKEQLELFRRFQSGEKELLEYLILLNLRLVLKEAMRSSIADQRLERFSAGSIGLIRAIEKYDPNLGYAFSTYAVPWIIQSIQRFAKHTSSVIRLPVHFAERRISVFKALIVLETKLHRLPTNQELAEILPYSIEQIAETRSIFADPLSMDHMVGKEDENDTSSLHDVLADSAPSSEELVANTGIKNILLSALSDLKEQERQIVLDRFGFIDGESKTLDEIGVTYGRTRERVRQIEVLAKQKLKRALNRQGIYEVADVMI